jgi:hypothetical protein
VNPRVRIIVLILVAHAVDNVGPLGVPAIASLIRTDLGLTLGRRASTLALAVLTFVFGVVGIGWNGVQHTVAGRAGRASGGGHRGRLRPGDLSAGVTQGPLAFGYVLQATGGYSWSWLGLALAMVGALGILALVRESQRAL